VPADGAPDEAIQSPVSVPDLVEAVLLPLPRLPAGPVVLRPARALQVSFTAVAPAKSTIGTENKPAAKPAAASTAAAAAPKPNATASPAPATFPAPSPTPKAAAPKPSAAAKPAATSVVKAPVPIQRSTAPATAAAPSPSPIPSPVASMAPVADPTGLPEYKLVQLPAQSPPPAPAASLPVGSQEISGTQGQTVSVKLNGRGWMFTGTGKTPAGVSFMEKTVQQDAEQFKFRLDDTGKLALQFQRQDVASGLMERQVAGLTVLARGAVSAAPTVTVAAAAEPSQYQPEYPVYQERVLAKASSVMAKQASPAPQAAAASVLPAASVAPLAETVPADAAGLLALAKRREQAGQSAGAIELYERFLKDWPAAAGSDEALFRLAKCLETVVDGRNIKRSYELYVKLQADYPYSGFADQAKERARYINRTYFRQ
jgi:hypothetical protein